MKCVVVVVFLALASAGRSAPVSDCDSLMKPITISNEEMLGRWLYIAGSSDIPGSRSLAHLMTSVWLDVTATSHSNILTLVQSQRVNGDCSSLIYNVTFENSTLLIEQPFYLKEVYLPSDCPGCLSVLEEVVSGKDTFTSLLLFSRTRTVPPASLETLKRQVECVRMPPPIVMDPKHELCPDDVPPSEGLAALNSLLEARMGHRVARLLDSFFDMFIN